MKYILILSIVFTSIIYAKSNEILLLHSYNKGLKWSDGISEGVQSVLKNHPEFELTTEYMDSKKMNSKVYFDILLTLYKKKFSKRKYSAVIVADNYAYKFALAHHEILFKNAPIIFCGVESFDKKNIPLKLQKSVTGVMEYKEIRKNISLISELFPQLESLYIISDDSFSSLAIKSQILRAGIGFEKQFKIIYDNKIDLNKLDQKLKKLPPNSAILFTSLYKDMHGAYIPYNELRKFFQSSKFPVFALNTIHLNEGVIGGVMINPQEQGIHAIEQSLEIMKGKNPLQVEVRKPLAHRYFDYEVLKKFDIELSAIPKGSTIINKPKNFFERNRKFVESIFLMFPLLLLLVIGLIINITKRISLEIKLVEQSKLDNVLLNNIKSSIFWKSKDNILLGCNESLCRLLRKSKDEIIGKKISQVIPEICQKFDDEEEVFVDEIETTLYNTTAQPIVVLIRRVQYLNKNNENAGIVTIISDITDIKELELKRKRDEQFVIQRSKLSEIGEMMTSIAHQWKRPLVEISSIAQELMYKQKRMQVTTQMSQEFVDEIMLQVQYMTNTIDDFRTFIKPSSKKRNFFVKKAIENLLEIVSNGLKYNYISVDFDFNIDHKTMIYGYENEFKQSILNVINNAKESILQKKATYSFDAKIEISVYEKKNQICIDINDNGIGIPKERLKTIFEPYVSSKKDGDGFGLYMTKLIIEDKMNGEIMALESYNGAKIEILIDKVRI